MNGDRIERRLHRISRECARKRRYDTEKQADRVVRLRRKDGSCPLRVYFCQWCGGWHITKFVELDQ